jgi:flagellar biosynthetic protein FliR
VTIDAAVAVAFVLVLARTSAWVMSIPLLTGVPGIARLAVALALSVFVTPMVHPDPPGDPLGFAVVVLGQVLMGLAMGWLTGLLFHAFHMAGSLIDAASGLSLGAMFDPVSGVQVSVYGRLTHLLFVTVLVVTDAHIALFGGFVRTFSAIPPDHFPILGGSGPLSLGAAVGGLMVAALEIAAPVLGALFLT